ncbi:MAG: N-6 DNA methylase, partial [Bacteroidales bacterium]|nr:N-6 DNA methylase [Bacteroidales bacterium]
MAGLDFLTQKYDRNLFLNFLRGFLTDKFETIEAEYISTSSEFQYIRKIYKLGEDKNLDLTVYEVEHHSENDPRVSLTREIFKFNRMHLVKKALVIFHLPRSDNFRLSLITAEVVGLKGKKTIVMESNPRRYSYLLGKRVHTKTPQQFLARPLSAGEDEKDVSLFGSLLKRFSVEVLTKQFYKELFDWYSWALSEKMGVKYPNDTSINTDDRQIEEHLIRLITRLLFVWFIKQKRLIPEAIFDADRLADILENFNPHSETEGIYYNAILQNLFFATLNRPISERAFATASTAGKSDGKEHYGIKTLFRDDNKKSWFKKSQREIVDLFKQVPFLNGGLFECLDKEQDSKGKVKYYDGFSRDNKNKQGMLVRAFIPNQLFFAEEHVESLPEYDKKQKKPINKERKVLGLITILKKYNFTVEENTPNDVDVALDPELLGKVFENLLGSYNPETRRTARKQSGSFYTPREIVNYMVDESMIAYLKQTVGDYETEYRKLLTAIDTDTKISLTEKVQAEIYNALRKCKILDPACGSGAFPMGVLLKIITIIQHLPLPNSISLFDLKLHLIENCIFGIDIQPIAVQISKLRFFISLICEQKPSNSMEENYGIKPLPNLETKFVAANTLIGLKQSNQQGNLFEDPQIEVIKRDLWQVRHEHFMANAPKQKKECRYKDTQLREKLARLLEINKMFIPKDAAHLAAWNPYDQNTSSPFFDAEWMFGIADGFNIVIGNPPYVQLPSLKNNPIQKIYSDADFKTYEPMGDIYFLFYEQGINLLKNHGHLCYITSNKWLRVGCGESLRKYFSIYNPKVLVDLGGNIFDAATVDTNILVIEKAPYENQTLSYAFKDRSKNMGDLISQDGISMTFSKEAWVILSPIEQSIKAKIEKIG